MARTRAVPQLKTSLAASFTTKSPLADTGGPVEDGGTIIEAGETVTRTEEPSTNEPAHDKVNGLASLQLQ
eukprot:3565-Heterococcus_DN1.PRE.2